VVTDVVILFDRLVEEGCADVVDLTGFNERMTFTRDVPRPAGRGECSS
jgi:hypothetical protein